MRGRDVACADIKLSPLVAYTLLDGAATDLAGTVVTLEDLWGVEARRLCGALARTQHWEERLGTLRTVLADRLHTKRSVDPEVAFLWRELLASGGRRRPGALAAETGWSRKRLWSRFTAQIGVTPKRAALIVRASAAIEALVAGTRAAEVAAGFGYADQAHLTRACGIWRGSHPRRSAGPGTGSTTAGNISSRRRPVT